MLVNDWFFCSDAQAIIALVRQKLEDSVPLDRIVRALRKSLEAGQVASAIEMARLQLAARSKFPLADQMLFTKTGLEQASSHAVASFKSQFVPAGLRVIDACCGVGGDLIALSNDHETIGIDSSQLMTRIAEHNAAANSRMNATTVCQKFENFNLGPDDFVHVDPDRRPSGRRTTAVRLVQPAWDWIRETLASRTGAVKLAPAAELDSSDSSIVHRQWIGYSRECREQVAWFNHSTLIPGNKSAFVIDDEGNSEAISGASELQPEMSDQPEAGDILLEPHSAVFAAGLAGELSVRFEAKAFSRDSPYLVTSSPVSSRLAQAFRVEAVGALDRKRLAAVLRQYGIGKIEWKQRGVEKGVFSKFVSIKGPGERSATVVLYRIGRRLNFVLCDRIETN